MTAPVVKLPVSRMPGVYLGAQAQGFADAWNEYRNAAYGAVRAERFVAQAAYMGGTSGRGQQYEVGRFNALRNLEYSLAGSVDPISPDYVTGPLLADVKARFAEIAAEHALTAQTPASIMPIPGPIPAPAPPPALTAPSEEEKPVGFITDTLTGVTDLVGGMAGAAGQVGQVMGQFGALPGQAAPTAPAPVAPAAYSYGSPQYPLATMPGGASVLPVTPAVGLPFVDVVPSGGGEAYNLLTSPWAPTMAGVRAKVHVLPNPATGRPMWFRPVGRPLLFSGDMATCKRVRRVGRKARRYSGGR